MKLHEDKILFADIIARAAEHPSQGGLGIPQQFIEKDYWITNALRNLAESQYADDVVFKGSTSLSKAYHIGMLLSNNIDIAIRGEELSDAKLKTIILSTEKSLSKDVEEINHPQASKGSTYSKTFYSYPLLQNSALIQGVDRGQLLFNINSKANSYPYHKIKIHSFVHDYLTMVMAGNLIEEFGLKPFEINVLDKRVTLTEKIVSLIRYSLAENYLPELEAKIRNFYDIYYLMQDPECVEYICSDDFINSFVKILKHERVLFDTPSGWRKRVIRNSPLVTDFENIWNKLKKRYETELPPLVYSLSIPGADQIGECMSKIIEIVKEIDI